MKGWDVKSVAVGLLAGLFLVGASALAQTGTWVDNASGIWSNAACWAEGVVADGAGNTAVFAGPEGGLTTNRTVTLDAPRVIGHLTFTNGNAFAWMLAGSGLTFNADGMGGGTSVVFVASDTKGQLGVFNGAATIEKAGGGPLILSTNTVCTGTLLVKQGSVLFNHVNGAQTMAVRLDPGDADCALDLSGLSYGNKLTAQGITVPDTGTGCVTIAYGGKAGFVGIASAITNDKTLTFSVTSGAGTLTLNNRMSGAGGLYKTGAAPLFIQQAQSYAGPTVLSQGSVILQAYSGNTPVLPVGNVFTMGDGNTGTNALSLVFCGANTILANLDLSVTTNGLSAAILGGLKGQGAGNYTLRGTVWVDRPYLFCGCTEYAKSLIIEACVSGPGGLCVTNAPGYTNTLQGANAYTGGTVVVSGTLRVAAGGTLGAGPVSVSGGAVLKLETDAAIDDDEEVALAENGMTSGRIDLNAGVIETVGLLKLGGKTQYAGTYGATGSGARNILDDFFTGMGVLNVSRGPQEGTQIYLY